MQDSLKTAFRLMSGGKIGRCSSEFPRGNCRCCVFGSDNDASWIGLLPQEKDYIINAGQNDNWQFETRTRSKSEGEFEVAICTRLRSATERGELLSCTNKFLDCLMYPFFPAKAEPTSSGWNVQC